MKRKPTKVIHVLHGMTKNKLFRLSYLVFLLVVAVTFISLCSSLLEKDATMLII